jgi:glucokinase
MTVGRRAGIDVGGTKCHGVVIDADGVVVSDVRLATPAGHDAIVDTLALVAEQLGQFDSIGLGVPGLITRDGVIKASPNLVNVRDFPVGRMLGDRLCIEVHVDNDATCATVAEWRAGAAQGADDFMMVTLGTGIGGGVVSNGRLVRGTNGFAGEFGHMVVDPNGPQCPCGRRGCWERYASGSGLAWLAREAVAAGRAASMVQLAGGDPTAIRGEHVQQAALAGDGDALAVIDTFADWVAIGLASLTNALDPALFVLGGGLATSADLLLEPIRQRFSEHLYATELRPHPALRFAHHHHLAGAVGAALLAEL